jgi:chitin disaccharide deacetylase
LILQRSRRNASECQKNWAGRGFSGTDKSTKSTHAPTRRNSVRPSRNHHTPGVVARNTCQIKCTLFFHGESHAYSDHLPKCRYNSAVRRLIVNADDFGLTPGVNRAIIEAHSTGLVSSATLMANGVGFDDAVQRAKAAPNLSVGCHIVLVDGTPLSDAHNVLSLTGNIDSQFERSIGAFAFRAIRRKINPGEVQAEAAAQIRKLQNAGIEVSHIDTHKHTHMFPQVLVPLLRAAKACGIGAIRNPFGRVAYSGLATRPKLWKRYGQLMLLNPFARGFLRSVQAEGVITPNGCLGVAATGVLDEALFHSILENLPDGTWEFVTHPGYNDSDLDGVATRLRQSRETELRLLTSPGVREDLARQGIELASYRDLLRKPS